MDATTIVGADLELGQNGQKFAGFAGENRFRCHRALHHNPS
jgi:hypothetical protein